MTQLNLMVKQEPITNNVEMLFYGKEKMVKSTIAQNLDESELINIELELNGACP